MRTVARMVLVALATIVCLSALADGDTRPATSSEMAWAKKTLAVLSSAIGQPPASWVVSGRSDAEPPHFLSGSAPRPMELVCEQRWEDRARKQRAQTDAMTAMADVKPDKAAEANAAAAEKRFQSVMAAVTAAAQKNDQAELKRLQPEMDAASKAYQAAMMAQNKGMLDAAAKGQATDADAKVRVETNSRYEYLQVAGQVAVGPGITGYHVKGSGDNLGTTWVFLGPWQISKDGSSTRFQLPQLTGPSCSVVTVKVQVEADQARAKGILEKVDWAALKALIK